MKLTKKQLRRIIKEEKQKLQEMDSSDYRNSDYPLLDFEYMVQNEVEKLIMSVQEDHSLEGEGISMEDLNRAIARGIDGAKAILRY